MLYLMALVTQLALKDTIPVVVSALIVLPIVSTALPLVVLYAKVDISSISVIVTQAALMELLHQVQLVYWILACTEPHFSHIAAFLVHPLTCYLL